MSQYVRKWLHVLFSNKKDAHSTIHNAPVNIDKDLDIVIGAGFGRTGTSSLQAGLQEMGYKCYHMKEAMMQPNYDTSHIKVWIFLYDEKLKLQKEKNVTSFKDWNLITLDIDKYGKYFEILFDKNGYNASVDWPSCMFYLELIEYYKRKGINYKVLLSVRDSAEQWWKSYSNTIGRVPEIFSAWVWRVIAGMKEHSQLAKDVLVLPFGDDKRMNKKHVMNQYLLWIESVKEFVDKDKLLVYNVKQGWKPLCTFLEIEIPDKYKDKPDEFIRTNTSNEMKAKLKKMEQISMYANIVAGVVVTSLVMYFSGNLGV